ncbi:MAG: hypothetical protein KJZ86_14345 [Caldilineaceae bacterium]|nr:hypothetical protein [Caldilineaceae bacterium]
MMGNDASSNETEGTDPADRLYGLFAGEDFLTDFETEHREEIVRDERMIQGLTIRDTEKIRDNPPDPRHPRSIPSSDSSGSDE